MLRRYSSDFGLVGEVVLSRIGVVFDFDAVISECADSISDTACGDSEGVTQTVFVGGEVVYDFSLLVGKVRGVGHVGLVVLCTLKGMPNSIPLAPKQTRMNDTPTILELAGLDSEPIEREELGDEKVAYRNVKVLQAGVWTDSGSRETIWYSPDGIANLEASGDNVVNIMHDSGNDVSAAGHMENLQADDGSLYADIVLDTSKSAGMYADENMQKTLETEGAKGFGGPSVEIAAEGQQVEYNDEKGMQELKKGVVTGLGFVANPASKPVSFARQTAQRGVALSEGEDGQDIMLLESERDAMNPELDPETLREKLSDLGVDLEDVEDEELEAFAENLLEDDEDEEEGGEDGGESEEGDDPEEDEEPEEEEEEGPEMGEVVETMQAHEERLTNLEDMAESLMAQEDLEEALEDFQQDLADADTVSELSEAREEMEKRLSELEDEPEDPRSLADNEGESEEVGPVQMVGEFDSRRQTYSR